MFLLRRPSARDIDAFLGACDTLPFSYCPPAVPQRPRGFKIDEVSAVIGHGEAAFARAEAALREWRQFDLGWVEVRPAGAPIAPGVVVAVLVRHFGFWSLNGCRVASLVEGGSAGRAAGFTYVTLTNHAECGEEMFAVLLDADTQAVSYSIRAVSKPRAVLAWLGFPLARRLQAQFRRDSVAAMTRAVAG